MDALMKVRILQLDDDDPRIFRDYAFVERNGGFSAAGYSAVYETQHLATDTLDDLFQIYNEIQPEGFHGHSLSVSDIVDITRPGGQLERWFCDAIGWRNVTEKGGEMDD